MSTALVRYAANPAVRSALARLSRGAIARYRASPSARAARLVRMGMRSYRMARPIMRKIGRSRIPRFSDRRKGKKSYARRATNATGSSIQRQTNMLDVDLPLRTLQTTTLTFPKRDNLENDKYNRTGRFLYFSGVRICESFVNNSRFVDAHFEIHYAIWQPKADIDDLNTFLAENKLSHFRDTRDNASGDTRNTSPFVDLAEDTTNGQFDMKYSCMPMSPDKINIIFHWRKRIGPSTLQALFETNTWKLEKWIPIKKKIEFNSALDQTPRRPFVVQTWVTCHNKKYWENIISSNAVEKNSVVTRSFKHQVYTHNVN